MLDAQRLALLAEIAHAGSIAGAAQRLAYTPSAVSQQVGKLEHDVGCQLLHRHPRGVTFTAIGQTLVAHAETVVGALRTAEHTVQEMLDEQPAQLALGSFASAAKAFLPHALAAFRRTHPSVALTLLDLEPPDGYGLVHSRDLDLLITHHYPGVSLPDPRGLQRRRLSTDPLQLVLPASHPKARRHQHSLDQLADEEWISGGTGVPNRACLDQLAHTAGLHLQVAYETRDYQVTLALIEAGLGIALIPASVLAHTNHTPLAIREIAQPTPARDIYLLHHTHPTRLVTDMITQLQQ